MIDPFLGLWSCEEKNHLLVQLPCALLNISSSSFLIKKIVLLILVSLCLVAIPCYDSYMNTSDPRNPTEPTAVHSVRLPHSMRDALRDLARQHHRSLHGEILQAIQEYLERQQKEQKHD